MSTLSSVVMRRVYAVHATRRFFPHVLVVGGVLGASLLGIGHDVWVAKVFENMPSIFHVRTFIAFALGAFLNTEFMVQVYTVLALLAGIALLRDSVRVMGALFPLPKLFFARSTF